MASHLSESEVQRLLQIAREAVGHAARREPLPSLALDREPPNLRHPGCAFVTLTKGGLLRGCIGGLEARLPLAEDVWQHAYMAATEDFRFLPVEASELPALELEISILTEPSPLAYDGAEDLLHKVRPLVDGVILTAGLRRATFLPQVWEKVPQPEEFFDRLAEKAGLPPDAWRDRGVEIQTYQVLSFHESQPPVG
ncbi:MAG TPA: AmmeMemoRadiSam system protein A [Anaerolineales bacterium]|nr:AmmeMemoRadiSam system protein A [Anaerolineales bacterium]